MRRALRILLLAAFLTTAAQARESGEALTKTLGALQQKARFPGFCVMLTGPDGVDYRHGFGVADLASGAPYTTTTVQPIASISKTVIAVALMQGIEQGRYTLDTPINTLLPFKVANPRFPDREITIRHLVTHTSGIVDRDGPYRASYLPGAANPLQIGPFLSDYFTPGGKYYSPANFNDNAPGTAYDYTNIGSTLGAYIVERTTGKSYASYTQEAILTPLGMKDSGWVTDNPALRYATLYTVQRKPYPAYHQITYPDGGLRTNCEDLATYLVAFANGRAKQPVLTAASIQAMLQPQFAAGQLPAKFPAKMTNHGVFWALRNDGSISHYGGDPGITTMMAFDPATRRGRILLVNLGGEDLKPEDVQRFGEIWTLLGEAIRAP